MPDVHDQLVDFNELYTNEKRQKKPSQPSRAEAEKRRHRSSKAEVKEAPQKKRWLLRKNC